MTKFITTSLGRLRLIGLLEGVSFLLLLGVAMPLKYVYNDPSWVEVVGQAHGLLFVLFVLLTFQVAIEYRWKFNITWKVLLGCVVPFGTFYVDKKILSRLPGQE